MVRRLDLFVGDPKDRSQVADPAQVKNLFIRQKIAKGEPPVTVIDPEADELTLAHTEEDRTLDPRRIRGYLAAVHTIWRCSVRLRANGRVYVHDETGFSTV
ncbi:MAG: hypothetical protein FJX78_05595 [Armatimonadetes bacterium]|nr:hypothetical protein [Armatimonadota bacterium]